MKSEPVVRVHCGWNGAKTLLRQTPGSAGVWNGVRFFVEEESRGFTPRRCDLLVVYNEVLHPLRCRCPRGRVWLLAGEPPTDFHHYLTEAYFQYDLLISQHQSRLASPQLYSHGALPWHIPRSFDALVSLGDNRRNKIDRPCAITSNLNGLPGHRLRLQFLDYLRARRFSFDLYGRGHTPLPLDDKFEVLYPRKYSFALENSSYPHYWTEKIADCYLSWTMPIYAGAPNIGEYFPLESMIQIDPAQPAEAIERIQSAIAAKAWERNRDAIEFARNKILQEYQFFPFIEKLYRSRCQDVASTPRRVSLLPLDAAAPRLLAKKIAPTLRKFGFAGRASPGSGGREIR